MINNNAILKFKAILACFFLLFLCSFQCFAGVSSENCYDGEVYEEDEFAIMTLKSNNSLYIQEVEKMIDKDDEFKYFILHCPYGKEVYFVRFKEEPIWSKSTSNSKEWLSGFVRHKTTMFSSTEQAFNAVKNEKLNTLEGNDNRGFLEDTILVCNFDVKDKEGNMIVKKHSYEDGNFIEEVKPSPEPNPSPDENAGIIKKILNKIGDIITAITEIPGKIIEGIKSLLIPSEAFMSEYKEKLMKKFAFVNDIQDVFKKVTSLIQQNDTPPKFEIDLGEKLGGKVTIMDFSQFDISLMRDLLGAFLLIGYIVSLFRKTPETIQASGGTNSDNWDNFKSCL